MELAMPSIFFRDDTSFEMFEIIMANRIFDVGGIFRWGGLELRLRELIAADNIDTFASTVESLFPRAESDMERDIERLLNLEQ
jgi:hypothetical protein